MLLLRTRRFSFWALIMDRADALAALCRLLCCNVDHMLATAPDQLRKLVKKRFLQWHPDKNLDNPNRYKENFILLKESWAIVDGQQGSSQERSEDEPDLFCYESMDESEDSDYNSTPFDDEFFHPSPKKEFAVPDDLRSFFRSKNNRRAGKLFAVFTHVDKEVSVQKMYKQFNLYAGCMTCYCAYYIRTNKDLICILINFATERRMGDLRKAARKVDMLPNEMFYAVKLRQFYKYLNDKYKDPFYKPVYPDFKEEKKPEGGKFNHKLIVDFALAHQISDAMQLMYEYAHLGVACDRKAEDITKEHEEDHEEHTENAKIYIYMSDRKKIAKNAIDAVMANLYMSLRKENSVQFIDRRCAELQSRLEDSDFEVFGLAHYLLNVHMPILVEIAKTVLECFISGEPRRRWVILQGPYKCGKTSIANGFLKFFEGVNINVNIDKNRLPFYLGQAIGRRFVLFDDVKGRSHDGNLMSGYGFSNVDDLRDHIDGHVEVQLEKKNQQPLSQVFPPGIITCNPYIIPQSILERVQGPITVTPSRFWNKHPVKITAEVIYIACVYANLLPASGTFQALAQLQKELWYAKHRQICDCLVVSKPKFLSLLLQWGRL